MPSKLQILKYSSILAIADAVPRLAATSFRPLVVVVLGAWGTVHPSTVSSLVRLGIPPDAVTAVLRKAVKILARHATVIARCRFAAAREQLVAQSITGIGFAACAAVQCSGF